MIFLLEVESLTDSVGMCYRGSCVILSFLTCAKTFNYELTGCLPSSLFLWVNWKETEKKGQMSGRRSR